MFIDYVAVDKLKRKYRQLLESVVKLGVGDMPRLSFVSLSVNCDLRQ